MILLKHLLIFRLDQISQLDLVHTKLITVVGLITKEQLSHIAFQVTQLIIIQLHIMLQKMITMKRKKKEAGLEFLQTMTMLILIYLS